MGATVDKIADAEKTIPTRVEFDLEKGTFKRTETAVDIADHEVSSDVVDANG